MVFRLNRQPRSAVCWPRRWISRTTAKSRRSKTTTSTSGTQCRSSVRRWSWTTAVATAVGNRRTKRCLLAAITGSQRTAGKLPVAELAQRGQLQGAGLFGEAEMAGLQALLGSGIGQAELFGQLGTGLCQVF